MRNPVVGVVGPQPAQLLELLKQMSDIVTEAILSKQRTAKTLIRDCEDSHADLRLCGSYLT